MPPVVHTPQSRPARRMVSGMVMSLLATMSTAVAQPGESIFDWNPADAPAERSASSQEHESFRNILNDPQSNSESFWVRDQRWTAMSERNNATVPSPSLPANEDSPSESFLLRSIPVSELSLAFAPLLLAMGLLRVRTNASYGRMYYS